MRVEHRSDSSAPAGAVPADQKTIGSARSGAARARAKRPLLPQRELGERP